MFRGLKNKVVPLSSRLYSSSTNEYGQYVFNRNPRNLEKMCIARKPSGWHVDKPGKEYWHKLEIHVTGKQVIASIVHNNGHIPVRASTGEWAIRKHLYSAQDKSAFTNLARVLGQRCLESGITELSCFLNYPEGSKVEAFIKELENSGVSLTEPPRYKHPIPSDIHRPEKPWEVE